MASKKTTTRRKNGTANGAAKRASSSASSMSLTESERQQVIDADRSIAQKKIAVANVEIQIFALEKEKKKLLNELRLETEAFGESVKALAEEHGIDVEGGASWRLDLQEMSFQQVKG